VEKEVETSAKFLKEVEDVRLFGEVFLRVSPHGRGKGIEFHSEAPAGSLSSEDLRAVEEGVRESSTSGRHHGISLTDLSVTLLKAFVDVSHPSRSP